ncbi:glutamyl-tRNA reductase [Brockia lithotrophica]|uniref:Glutamyl-tRNA reductase n=1 Tax=Brockia lithotrophica TaxID=933949 RepID=A0A660KYV3_9BACL|nr:glutamyl-tRNA reductase [Brockia lithotrophica]RKQ83583.1 glutamyl-tRNA reductase [Brockia lithotrophica]
MELFVYGVSVRTAPLVVRERLSAAEGDVDAAYEHFSRVSGIYEVVLLFTCNRTEVYLLAADSKVADEVVLAEFARLARAERESLRPYVYRYEGAEAVRHLFRVAAGLDSLVIGETEILGQVRRAWEDALARGATGKVLNQAFLRAIAFAKRVHRDWRLNDNPVSVAYVAVSLIRQIFGDLRGRRVLLVGAGETGRLLLTHLRTLEPEYVVVLNRTEERAHELVRRLGIRGEGGGLDELPRRLKEADVVLTATSAPTPLVRFAWVEEALRGRRDPLLFVDLSVPRDVPSEVGGLSGAYVYNVDDLKGVVEANLAWRRRMKESLEGEVAREAQEFLRWLEELDVLPTLVALREKAFRVQEEVLASLYRKLPNLDERERRILRKHTRSIVNQILREPLSYLKERAGTQEGREAREVLARAFGLSEEVLRRTAYPSLRWLTDPEEAEDAPMQEEPSRLSKEILRREASSPYPSSP